MALTKEVEWQGEFLRSGVVQVCRVTTILEDDVPISTSRHRHVINPGDDYSQESNKVQKVCEALHTPAVIVKWLENQAANA